jgi:CCR4-NOT transcription complex subunit 1
MSTLGILTQMAIVSGIMLTQMAGLNLATTSHWRYVFFISACLAVVQLFFASMVVESPAFLLRKNRLDDYKTAGRRLWGNTIPSLGCKGIKISSCTP